MKDLNWESLMPEKDGLIILVKGLALKKCKDRRSSFCSSQGSRRGPEAVKKITGKEEYLPERVFNADESVLFWEKKCHKRLLSERKRTGSRNEGRKGGVTPILREICRVYGQNCPHLSSC